MGAYNALNDFDEARKVYDEARGRGVDGLALRLTLYLTAFLQNDGPSMAEQLKWADGKPGIEDQLLSPAADTAAYYGHLKRARELSERAANSVLRSGAPETAALWTVIAALREAEVGNSSQARKDATRALALREGRDIQLLAALALARIGDLTRAEELASNIDEEHPRDTQVQNYWLPSIRAAVALGRGLSSPASSALEPATAYELGALSSCSSFSPMYPVYLRGEAYLKAGNGSQAVTEFQEFVSHPGVVQNFVLGPLARLQLARAQVMMGDKDAARKSYLDFLALWKDADPDIPIYKQAKAECAKLH